jgi:hypothetical protein
MKKIQFLAIAVLVVLLSACSSGGGKKVLVMASGKVEVEGNTIKLEPGTTHNEKELNVSGDRITVITGASSADYSISEPGLYLLNIKTDTLVGSYQRVGTEANTARVTQEDLQKHIDSLQQLMTGANASAANRNYCIPPNRVTKISDNVNAQVIGPYLKMPSSFEGGKEYEIYKFSTNKEMVETIDKLKKLQQ